MGSSRLRRGDESYYLAGRSLTGPILLVTMAATNFSAFTVYGSSGASYRIGLSFLPIMAFGTDSWPFPCTFWKEDSLQIGSAWGNDGSRDGDGADHIPITN